MSKKMRKGVDKATITRKGIDPIAAQIQLKFTYISLVSAHLLPSLQFSVIEFHSAIEPNNTTVGHLLVSAGYSVITSFVIICIKRMFKNLAITVDIHYSSELDVNYRR